jgi:hypothetical protein
MGLTGCTGWTGCLIVPFRILDTARYWWLKGSKLPFVAQAFSAEVQQQANLDAGGGEVEYPAKELRQDEQDGQDVSSSYSASWTLPDLGGWKVRNFRL